MRARGLIAMLGVALLATCLAAALACGGRALGSEPDPAVSADAPQKAPGPPSDQTSKDKKEEEPRVVRWVCTDHLCGGCDGECSRHGHVSTHKGGHCACTPKEGSALDRATRKAFEGREKGK
jgi:hypothetical protein